MSDTAPATDAPESTPDGTDAPDTGPGPDLAAEVEKWKAQARKHEDRAKANAAAAKELEQFRQQSMSDTEKAIEVARAEGRQLALAEVGAKVANAEIRAAAAGRLEADQLDLLLENLNVARFIGEDGEVNREAVVRFVDGIAPKAAPPAARGASDQGARTSMPLNGDPIENALKAALGG